MYWEAGACGGPCWSAVVFVTYREVEEGLSPLKSACLVHHVCCWKLGLLKFQNFCYTDDSGDIWVKVKLLYAMFFLIDKWFPMSFIENHCHSDPLLLMEWSCYLRLLRWERLKVILWNTEGGLQLASPCGIWTISYSRIPSSRIWKVPYPRGTDMENL